MDGNCDRYEMVSNAHLTQLHLHQPTKSNQPTLVEILFYQCFQNKGSISVIGGDVNECFHFASMLLDR